MAEELLIFVGYSDDAKEEAVAVHELERPLQETLKRLNKVASAQSNYSTLKIFLWDYDAKLGVGGQDYAISSELERAALAIFVFKERVGRVTWKELTSCREREKEKRIPVIVLFPKNSPEPDRISLLEIAEGWTGLLRKKSELTADWDEEDSHSVTPLEPYRDRAHLKEMLFKRLEDILPQLIRAEQRPLDKSEPDSFVQQSELKELNQVTGETEYSPQAVQQYRSRLRAEVRSVFTSDLSDTEFLRRAGYLKGGRLTVAGALLFTNQPCQVVPSALIRCTKYDGIDKTAARTRRNYGGPLLSQIVEARDFIEENTGNREIPVESSMQSRKVYQYPMVCVREVLANAACHRDYGDAKRMTYVNIFVDRIEIKSPGSWVNKSLPDEQTIPLQQLASESIQRNMILAHAVASVDMMEMEGSGIPTSLKDCKEHGSPEPEVVQTDGFVIVTIYPNPAWDDVPKQATDMDTASGQRAVPAEAVSNVVPRPPVIGFVARRDEQGRDIVECLREELAPGRNQPVTLSGPGGIGKTTLAAEAARALLPAYEGRITWSSADGRADFSLLSLLDDIATQLGRAELRTLAPAVKEEQVRSLVAEAPALVVLDNYETIAAAEQKRIEAWFKTARCSALFTSRPRVAGTVFVPVSAMSRAEADEFLERLAGQTQDAQIFTAEVRRRVYETAEANPFVMQWVVAQIDDAQEPDAVLKELAQGQGDAAERVFERSFNLLDGDGRDALLALSLFAPSATREALSVAAGFGDEGRVREAVRNLHRLWLIKLVDDQRRLAIAGLTRTLASARLLKDPRAGEFRRRFVAHFLRFAREREEPTPENYDALELERDNLLSAAEAAFASKDWGSVMGMAYALANPVDGMLSVRGYWGDAVRLGEQALQAARSSQDEARIAGLSHNLAVMYQYRGELAEARRLYGESLEIKKRLGDQGVVATTLHQLATLAQVQGEVEEARRLYSESLEINKRLGNQSGVASTLHQLGRLAQDQGELEEARRLYGESLEIKKRLGDQNSVAITLHSLAILAGREGDLAEARRLFNESLEITNRLGDKSNLALLFHNLGLLEEREGNKAEAARLLREALSILERLRSPAAKDARRDLVRVEASLI